MANLSWILANTCTTSIPCTVSLPEIMASPLISMVDAVVRQLLLLELLVTVYNGDITTVLQSAIVYVPIVSSAGVVLFMLIICDIIHKYSKESIFMAYRVTVTVTKSDNLGWYWQDLLAAVQEYLPNECVYEITTTQFLLVYECQLKSSANSFVLQVLGLPDHFDFGPITHQNWKESIRITEI